MIRIYLREETFTGRDTREFWDPDKLEKILGASQERAYGSIAMIVQK